MSAHGPRRAVGPDPGVLCPPGCRSEHLVIESVTWAGAQNLAMDYNSKRTASEGKVIDGPQGEVAEGFALADKAIDHIQNQGVP